MIRRRYLIVPNFIKSRRRCNKIRYDKLHEKNTLSNLPNDCINSHMPRNLCYNSVRIHCVVIVVNTCVILLYSLIYEQKHFM